MRILVTSTDVMMYLFLVPHVNSLIKDGHSVDIAISRADEYHDFDYPAQIREMLPDDCQIHVISSVRSPYSLKNIPVIRELSAILSSGSYDLLWTNEPVVGVVSRIANSLAFNKRAKVLYLVHGFHFFKGSPLLNWAFFPVEFIMSFFTNYLVTINKTDYSFSKCFPWLKRFYIPGIGFDSLKFKNAPIEPSLRKELGVQNDSVMILAVGELLPRKNHATLLKAFAKCKDPSSQLVICGIGGLYDDLVSLSLELGVNERVHFVGQRSDIDKIMKVSDIFIHPSVREGLGIAPLEAMAAGLPIVTSNAQGIVDYSVNDKTGFVFAPDDVDGFSHALSLLCGDPELRQRFGDFNSKRAFDFDLVNSIKAFSSLINKI